MDFCNDESFLNLLAYPLTIVRLLYFMVPIALIIMGSIDLVKEVVINDNKSKGYKNFGKRIISAALVFLVVPIVATIISFVSDENTCINFIIEKFNNPDLKVDEISGNSELESNILALQEQCENGGKTYIKVEKKKGLFDSDLCSSEGYAEDETYIYYCNEGDIE